MSTLTAPDFLFGGKEKQVIQFLWRQLHHLQKAQPESETYSSVLEMFEDVVKLGLFGLLADQKVEEVEGLLCDVFDLVLNKLTCRADSDVMLRGLIEDLLKGLFEEMTEVPASLLDVFLRPLERSSDKSQAANAARSIVKAVIRRLTQSMQDALCRYLMGKVDRLVAALPRASKEEQKEVVRKNIKPVFETILNVSEGHGGLNAQLLPHVAAHMEHANPLLRRLAVNWMFKLFVEHTTHWTEYHLLFNATLDSLRDGVKEIRLSAVRWYGDFIEKHRAALVGETGLIQEEIANRIRNPLLDSDVDVRLKATQVLVELVSQKRALHLFPVGILEIGISRMTDTKSSVRKVAIREFGSLYQRIREGNDKVPEPYNQIPAKLLEVYACPTSRPDQRWEAEQAFVEYALGDNVEEATADGGELSAKQRFAINMIKVWTSVPMGYRNAFSKMLTSKKAVREIAQVLPSLILTIKPLTKEWRARGPGSQKQPELVKATLVFEKVLQQLHRSCGLRNGGLELMLAIEDESVLAETVTLLQQINDRPEDGLVLKGKLLSLLKKALKDTTSGKELVEKVDVLLTRICFPVSTASIRHMVTLFGSYQERHSGKRALQLSELLLVVAQSFPETFVSSKEAVSALTDKILLMAEEEYATRSWGGEADLHSALPPPADTSPGSVQRMKKQTLHERRETLRHLLLVFFTLLGGKHTGAAPAAAAGKKAKHSVFDALHTKKAVERLTKTLRKLALHTTEPIAKLAMRVLGRVIERPQSGASVGDLSGKADFMKAMLVDCERCFTAKTCSYLTVTALRVAQQCVIQHPRPDAALSKATLKFVHELLPKLAAATIKTKKQSSYANPPLECSVYRAGLKFVTTCLLSAQDKTSSAAVKDVVDTYSSLLKLSGVCIVPAFLTHERIERVTHHNGSKIKHTQRIPAHIT